MVKRELVHVSRRDFLKKGTSLAAKLMVGGAVLSGGCAEIHQEVFRTDKEKVKRQFPDKFELFYEDYDKLKSNLNVVNGRAYRRNEIQPGPTIREIVQIPAGKVYRVPDLNAEYMKIGGEIIFKYSCRIPPSDLEKRITSLQKDNEDILKGIKVSPLSTSNLLIFNGKEQAFGDFSSLRDMLDFVDIAPKQVRVTISALEYFEDNTFDMELNLDAYTLEKGIKLFTLNLPSSPSGDPLKTGIDINPFNRFRSHKETVVGAWKFLDSYGEAEIATHVDTLVSNGEMSEIADQANIPYREFLEGKYTSIQGIKYRNTGTDIKVTVHANDEGFISVELDLEKGEQTGFMGTEQQPIFKTSTYKTKYMAKNGEPVIVGVSSASKFTEVDRGIPFFSKLPIIGPILSSKSNEKKKTQSAYIVTVRVLDREDSIDYRIENGNLLPGNLLYNTRQKSRQKSSGPSLLLK